jgi:mannose-6-phosphate isomerase-like protein (cupin superfamily)
LAARVTRRYTRRALLEEGPAPAKKGETEIMKHQTVLTVICLATLSTSAVAQEAAPPAIVLGEESAKTALAGVNVPGFAMKTLHTTASEGIHTTIATIERNRSETTGLSHDHVTEIYKILEGEATLLTGGALRDGKPFTAAGDPAVGPSHQGVIEGGKQTHVTAGDTVVIVPGTPHEFVRIDDHITYLAIRLSREEY